MFKKILVANRASFASRAINTIKSMNIEAHAVFTKEDEGFFYQKLADYAYLIKSDYANSYLDSKTILDIAISNKIDAIFLGTSALSYDTTFLNACEDNNITTIGTSLDFTVLNKDKIYIKNFAKSLDIKVVEACNETSNNIEAIYAYFEKLKKPIFIKPNFGFNSLGVNYIENEKSIESAFINYNKEVNKNLKDASFIIEKAMLDKKLIKLIALRDNFNNTNILGFIDISINNNYKNIVAETFLNLGDSLKSYIINSVKLLCENLNLIGYAEFEFLIDNKSAYLLEINSKFSELYSAFEIAYDIDIIKQVILISSNNKLEITGKDLKQRAYVLQCKLTTRQANLYIDKLYVPSCFNIYNELNIKENYLVPTTYDDILFKITSSSRSKLEAVSKLKLIIDNLLIDNEKTNIADLKSILSNSIFLNSCYDLNLKNLETCNKDEKLKINNMLLAIDFYNNNDNKDFNILSGGKMQKGINYALKKEEEKTLRKTLKETFTSSKKELTSKIPGKVLKILVKENTKVEKGEVLLILEAMKMENRIYAEKDGEIDKIFVKEQENIMTGAMLLNFK